MSTGHWTAVGTSPRSCALRSLICRFHKALQGWSKLPDVIQTPGLAAVTISLVYQQDHLHASLVAAAACSHLVDTGSSPACTQHAEMPRRLTATLTEADKS
eukprot:32725-Chlamydomonas_euryale.AAC.8